MAEPRHLAPGRLPDMAPFRLTSRQAQPGMYSAAAGTWATYRTDDLFSLGWVNAAAVDQTGRPWFGGWPGVAILSGTQWITLTTANSGILNDDVRDIAFDHSGQPWFAHYGGVSFLSSTGWVTYTQADLGWGDASVNFTSVAVDQENRPWFTLWWGYGVAVLSGTHWITYTTQNSGLGNDYVYDVAVSPANVKWFAAYNMGVSRFDGTTWTNYTSADGVLIRTSHVAVEPNGRAWFSSWNGNVMVIDDRGTADKADDIIAIYTPDDGLAHEQVNAIAVDSGGYKWFGTAGYGLSVLDDRGTWSKADDRWATFTTADGLASNSVSAIAIDDTRGQRWFGTMGGASRFATPITCPDFVDPPGVDVGDIQFVAANWRQSAAGRPYDQNGDGIITIVDIVRVAARWGDTCSWAHSEVIVDGPWPSLPSGAGPGLALDKEWGALTLRSDMTNLAFVLQPDPDKTAVANSVQDLEDSAGRLYVGYGDLLNNRGPVDIVGYGPLSGTLHREVLDIPEESVGGWYSTADGRLYAGGEDSQESWTFGSFYVNDGLSWEKRRTIYEGLHVNKVVDFQGRLYAAYGSDGTPPVTYTFALASDNQGASWSYERLGSGTVEDSAIYDVDTVTHARGKFLYALVNVRHTGGQNYVTQLYRFDGNAWQQVTISDPLGQFTPRDIFAFQGYMLVAGYVVNYETQYWTSAVYALGGQTQTEVAFLRGRYLSLALCNTYDRWLYCILQEPPFGAPVPAYNLYRTQDTQTWEKVGTIALLPGAKPRTLAFARDRLYVGATNVGWWDVDDHVELWPAEVYTIENATLQWEADVPAGAQLALKIRTTTESAYAAIFEKPWVGPDGTENTAFTSSGQALHPHHNGDNILQVAIYKTPNGSGQSPHLKWVTLNTNHGSVTLAVDEGPGLYTAVNSADPSGADYLSPVFRLQEPIVGGHLFFDEATPGQTSLRFQVRSASTESQLEQQTFAGPDGTPDTFYQTSGQSLWGGHDGHTYVQYRALLTSSNPTLAPFLRKVVLVTRNNSLDRFSIQLSGSVTWIAGQPNAMRVTARYADGRPLPIYGRISLSAIEVDQGEAVPVQPTELSLVNGTGTVNVLLQRAAPTRICVNLAGVVNCSSVITVQPGSAAAISVTTNLVEPSPNWAPVGQVGQPFTLSLAILDRYRNVVTGYTGTVRCERWRWASEGQLFPPYTFQPSDQGYHLFPNGVTIDADGEWNLVCFDEADPRIAGTQTVNIQSGGKQNDVNAEEESIPRTGAYPRKPPDY